MNNVTARRSRIFLGCVAFGISSMLSTAHAEAPRKSITIAVVQAMTSEEWATEIRDGATAAAAQFNGAVKLKFAGPPGINPPKQAQIFQDVVQTGVDAAIIVNVAESFFLEPAREAQEKGVAVVWTNDPPLTAKNALFVGQDSYVMGQRVGNILADGIIKKSGKPADQITGEIVMGMCARGIATLEQRSAGAAQALHARLPKVTIPPFFETKVDRGASYASWEQSAVSHPKALAYLDPCESGEENIAKIVSEKKLPATVTSWDAPEEIRSGIRDGQILAAIPPKFFANTYIAVYLTAKYLLEGKKMPTGWVQVPITEVNPSNIAGYIKAFSSPENQTAYNKSFVEGVLRNIPSALPPISEMDHSK